ncbi:hypothetical protein ACFE04_021761 [Oxalis oulophora]
MASKPGILTNWPWHHLGLAASRLQWSSSTTGFITISSTRDTTLTTIPPSENPKFLFQLKVDAVVSEFLSLYLSPDLKYSRREMRKQRKMGHITIVGPSLGIVESRLNSMLREETAGGQSSGNLSTFCQLDHTLATKQVSMPKNAFNGSLIDNIFCVAGLEMQMPRSVLVVTVTINNATNVGLLAVRMLGSGDADLLAMLFIVF